MYLLPTNTTIYKYGDEYFVPVSLGRSLHAMHSALNSDFGPVRLIAPTCRICNEQELDVLKRKHGLQSIWSFGKQVLVSSLYEQSKKKRLTRFRRLQHWRDSLHTHSHYSRFIVCLVDSEFDSAIAAAILLTVGAGMPAVTIVTERFANRDQFANGLFGRLNPEVSRAPRLFGELFQQSTLRFLPERSSDDLQMFSVNSIVNTEMYSDQDCIAHSDLALRLSKHSQNLPLRLVAFDLLGSGESISDAIELVRRSRSFGADISLDIFNGGTTRTQLNYQIAKAGLLRCIKVLNTPLRFGQTDRETLSAIQTRYDAQLSTSKSELDLSLLRFGYSQGLPLLLFSTEEQIVRSMHGHPGVLMSKSDIDESARQIAELDLQRGQLHDPSFEALHIGLDHSIERQFARVWQAVILAFGSKANSPRHEAKVGNDTLPDALIRSDLTHTAVTASRS